MKSDELKDCVAGASDCQTNKLSRVNLYLIKSLIHSALCLI